MRARGDTLSSEDYTPECGRIIYSAIPFVLRAELVPRVIWFGGKDEVNYFARMIYDTLSMISGNLSSIALFNTVIQEFLSRCYMKIFNEENYNMIRPIKYSFEL